MTSADPRRSGSPFFRIPPFPGARHAPLAQPGSTDFDPDLLRSRLVAARVGGAFWAPPPALPPDRDVILAPHDRRQLDDMLRSESADRVAVVARKGWRVPDGIVRVDTRCDPWALAGRASRIRVGGHGELAFIAALTGVPVHLGGAQRPVNPPELHDRLVEHVRGWSYACPFSGAALGVGQVIDQLAAWRALIEDNRSIEAVIGVAGWKHTTVDPLLWGGTGPVRHVRRLPGTIGAGTRVLAWRSRAPAGHLASAELNQARIGEIEDGFIRSAGLGANCVPPLSVVVDWRGIYFDPGGPSALEDLLEQTVFDSATLARAAALRQRIVSGAISKYGAGGRTLPPLPSDRRRVLVTGQVEDDRSILAGGRSVTNLDLLKKARALEPDAWLVYKPHPDVEAGHRKGHIPPEEVLRHADAIESAASIAGLLDNVDGLHVITSLAGFEGLLRGKAVTTHGVPFYAGWGLTRDLAPPVSRRSRRLSLDELAAGTLLLYPRYVDPVTRLPCPAEVLVDRFENGRVDVRSPLITLREWQGRLRNIWRGLRSGAR